MQRLAILVVLVGCGEDNPNPGQADAAIDAPTSMLDGQFDGPSGAALTLTSPVVTEGGTIPMAVTCDGANTSPALAWTGHAMGAQSYAVVLTDTSNGVLHWVIYDIPASLTGLPENVMKVYAPSNVMGAHQTTSYQATVRGYLGPCPPPQDGGHSYEFALYGLSVATLPGTSMTTTRQQAVMLITQNMTAKATLTGMYDRN